MLPAQRLICRGGRQAVEARRAGLPLQGKATLARCWHGLLLLLLA